MVSFVREGVYANTAMYGLAPRSALQAGAAAVSDWAAGRVPFAAWEPDVERARRSLARLHGVAPEDATSGGTVSSLVAAVANDWRELPLIKARMAGGCWDDEATRHAALVDRLDALITRTEAA